MEYVNSTVVQPPPVQPRRLGQTECRWGWIRCTLALVLFLAVTGCFVAAAYSARHRTRDLVYSIVIYFLLVLLVCCVVKFEKLRHDPAAAAGRRRAARIALWVLSVTLTNTSASRVADAAPELALKLSVWAVAAVVLGIVFYYLFRSAGAGCCNAEHARGQADAGRLRPEKASRELSPDEKV
jgi:hypothetical protein